jgi:hypothetical protein
LIGSAAVVAGNSANESGAYRARNLNIDFPYLKAIAHTGVEHAHFMRGATNFADMHSRS